MKMPQAFPSPVAAQMPGKPENMTAPHYPSHGNFGLTQMIHNSANPVHEAHVQKAFQLHAPHLKAPAPMGGAPQMGSPWTAMMKK